MAISGQQVIAVGLQNESANSDSLYNAFNKTVTNFATLFACASPYNTFTGNTGITVNADSNTNIVDITNTGVTYLVAGSGVTLSANTGNITISTTGSNGGSGTVTSVGVTSSTLNVTNSPIVGAGNIVVNLPSTGITAATYTNPTVTVDSYGRVTTIANNTVSGTVTSVGITPGTGIQVTTSGNSNINPGFTITNTGVTRINQGAGISVSGGGNGDVTISTTSTGGTVTGVTISSNNLTVTGGTITTTGTITVDLPANVPVTGQLLLSGSENLATGAAANLLVTASYFTTTGASTATLAAGTAGQIKTFMMAGDAGDMVITVTNAGWKTSGTGTMTFNDIGDGCTLQYVNSKWYCIGNNGVVFA